MDIILQLDVQVANLLHRNALSDQNLIELFTVLANRKAIIRPQHPGETDELLASFFIVETSGVVSEDFLNELRNITYVQAAYVKPQAEAPC